MDDLDLEAVKQFLADEFGLKGIDDPEQVRSIFLQKLAAMSATDRIAASTQLGTKRRLLEEIKLGGTAPDLWHEIAAVLFLAVPLWFLWRPLSVIIVLFFASGKIRHFAVQNALFWAPNGALIFGALYGVAVAVVVRAGAAVSIQGLVGNLCFGIFGFFAAVYVGYGVPGNPRFRTPADEKRMVSQVGAFLGYIIVALALFLVPLIIWPSAAPDK